MADDFARLHPAAPPDVLRAMVTLDIEDLLRQKNKVLSDFGISSIAPFLEMRHAVQRLDVASRIAMLPLLQRDLMLYNRVQLQTYFETNYPLLRPAQKQFVDAVLASNGGAFFLDAVGGAGKTFCENLLLAKFRSDGKVAVAVATSGIAATLLAGGRTARGALKLPILYSDGCTWNVSAQSQEPDFFRHADLFIWDETAVAHRYLHEALDNGLHDILQNDRPFGGKSVFSGDFRQTLPMVPKGNEAQIVAACLKKSHLWDHLSLIRLHENMRVRQGGSINAEAEAYAAWLLKLGNGTLPPATGQADPSFI